MEFPGAAERKKKEEERGYTFTEMEETRQRIHNDWREWRHRFEQMLQVCVADGERGRQAVQHAEKLADEVTELLQRRKPEGIDV
jgi:hypothetical protein